MKTTDNSTHNSQKSWFDQRANVPTDDFEKDAYEGWKQQNFDASLLQTLNQQYTGNSIGYTAYVFLAAIICTTIFISSPINIAQKNTNNTTQPSTQTTSNPSIEPHVLAEITVLPIHEQIQPKSIARSFQLQKNALEKITQERVLEEDMNALPLNPNVKLEVTKETSFATTKAKEIYLEGYKLIDYRSYRARPIEKNRPTLQLTGTPADREMSGITETSNEWNELSIPYMDFIQTLLKAFKKERFEKVIQLGNQITKVYPDDVNALFYKGLAQYNLGKTAEAIQDFEQLKMAKYSNFSEESDWFLAHCYLAQKDTKTARTLLQAIIAQQGFYKMEAEKLLVKTQLLNK